MVSVANIFPAATSTVTIIVIEKGSTFCQVFPPSLLSHQSTLVAFVAEAVKVAVYRFNDKPSARGSNSGLSDECELGEM